MDEKARLMIPSRWRGDIGREVYIAPSTEGGLMLMSQTQFDDLRHRVASLTSLTDEEKEDFKRHLEYNSDVSTVDVQGRIFLKDEVLNRGGMKIKTDVVLRIREHGIEVFSEDRWSQVRDSHQASYFKGGRKAGI